MPNIKVYGLTKKEFDNIFNKIKELFKDESYAGEIVVTRIKSKVIDLGAQSRPYIQLELNCMKNYEFKRDKLKTLGLDIQVLRLHEFIGNEGINKSGLPDFFFCGKILTNSYTSKSELFIKKFYAQRRHHNPIIHLP